jgi:ERF superfamily
MSVHKKLQAARLELSQTALKKSGKNKFAGFEYFELGDFLPATHSIFNSIGICGVFSFYNDDQNEEWCTLKVIDVEDSDSVVQFNSPVVKAEMNKSNPIQELGATHTYMRRYMWLLALELTENDQVDAVDQSTFKQTGKTPAKTEPIEEVVVNAPVEVKAPTDKDLTFVEGLVKFGKTCDTLAMLADLWKGNQKEIDKLKVDHPPLYDQLLAEFGKVKKEVAEKVKAQSTKEKDDGI